MPEREDFPPEGKAIPVLLDWTLIMTLCGLSVFGPLLAIGIFRRDAVFACIGATGCLAGLAIICVVMDILNRGRS